MEGQEGQEVPQIQNHHPFLRPTNGVEMGRSTRSPILEADFSDVISATLEVADDGVGKLRALQRWLYRRFHQASQVIGDLTVRNGVTDPFFN